MKRICLMISLLVSLSSCEKSPFESYLNRTGLEEAIEIKLYPSSNILTADGKSELSFLVKAFIEIPKGEGKDTIAYKMTEEDLKRVTIQTVGGERVENFIYKTDASGKSVQSFIAKLGSLTSPEVKVKLDAPVPNVLPVKKIPIDVYVLHDPLQLELANAVSDKALAAMFERANHVFANKLTNGAHAMDSKIEFNMHRKIVKNVGKLTNVELNKLIVEEYMVNPKDILHVWICNTFDTEYSSVPKYKLDPTFQVDGLTLSYVTDYDQIKVTNPKDAGIIVPLNGFIPLSQGLSSIRFEKALARFFGLLETQITKSNATALPSLDLDFCPDTYNYSNLTTGIEKRTVAKDKKDYIYFRSTNVMDGHSSSMTITIDQVNRMHHVMKYAAFRQF